MKNPDKTITLSGFSIMITSDITIIIKFSISYIDSMSTIICPNIYILTLYLQKHISNHPRMMKPHQCGTD